MIQKPKLDPDLISYEAANFIIDTDEIINGMYISNCTLELEITEYIVFEKCLLKNVNFQQTDLYKVEFTDVRFEKCDLSNVNFAEGILHRCEFIDCKMVGLNLEGATLHNVSFEACMASFAMFNRVHFRDVCMTLSNLDNSSFQGSHIKNLEMIDCSLKQAYLAGTSFKGVDFSTCQIEGIVVRIDELSGIIVSPSQAIELSKLMGIVIK